MKIYDCKCKGCKAEFQAILEKDGEKVQCPSCDSEKVEMTEVELGCGGSCGACSGNCGA
jgi:predicted Zn-ribbon and HTH transcriptional regulator